MLRGYQPYILALGVVLAGHHPNAEAQPKQISSQERSARALENIAVRYDEQAEGANRSNYEKQCAQGRDQRDSDLCAQWKAADAAADSAWWAAVGAFSSAISTLLVLIALYLAFRSNWIARETAKCQLRAYVFPKILKWNLRLELPSGSRKILLNVVLENRGQTPANAIAIAVEAAFEFDPTAQFAAISVENAGQVNLLGPCVEIDSQAIAITLDDAMAVFRAEKELFVYGAAFYQDVFETTVRLTRFCWQIRFGKGRDDDFPNQMSWTFHGPHNCSDEQCDVQYKQIKSAAF